MRCSIVVCTRNGELFLEEQLASFLRQEHRPDEIIICDDASSDATPSIIDGFVPQATSLGIECRGYRHQSPLGVTGNFEFACGHATGDIIFLSDQDDRWHEGKIATIFPLFVDPAVVLVNSNAGLIDGEGRTINETLFDRLRFDDRERKALVAGDLAKVGAYKNLFTGATMAFRRVLLDSALPFSLQVHHDDWLPQIAWISGGKVQTVFERLMDYRLHSANTIGLGDHASSKPGQSPSSRLSSYLNDQVSRLSPVVEHGNFLAASGKISMERLQVRRRQLELAQRRANYSANPIIRSGQVLKAASGGLYASMFRPWRTGFLDLFRTAGERQLS
ncbi:MAG: glycosyltransferase [Proteobacteria bacterium]|nr:glycosyltransferase [Pseudomonadota bacterium]